MMMKSSMISLYSISTCIAQFNANVTHNILLNHAETLNTRNTVVEHNYLVKFTTHFCTIKSDFYVIFFLLLSNDVLWIEY